MQKSQKNESQKSQLIATGFSKGMANDSKDFKSPVSTDSTTAAAEIYDSTFLFYRQGCFHPAAGGKTPPWGEKSIDFLLFRGQTEGTVV